MKIIIIFLYLIALSSSTSSLSRQKLGIKDTFINNLISNLFTHLIKSGKSIQLNNITLNQNFGLLGKIELNLSNISIKLASFDNQRFSTIFLPHNDINFKLSNLSAQLDFDYTFQTQFYKSQQNNASADLSNLSFEANSTISSIQNINSKKKFYRNAFSPLIQISTLSIGKSFGAYFNINDKSIRSLFEFITNNLIILIRSEINHEADKYISLFNSKLINYFKNLVLEKEIGTTGLYYDSSLVLQNQAPKIDNNILLLDISGDIITKKNTGPSTDNFKLPNITEPLIEDLQILISESTFNLFLNQLHSHPLLYLTQSNITRNLNLSLQNQLLIDAFGPQFQLKCVLENNPHLNISVSGIELYSGFDCILSGQESEQIVEFDIITDTLIDISIADNNLYLSGKKLKIIKLRYRNNESGNFDTKELIDTFNLVSGSFLKIINDNFFDNGFDLLELNQGFFLTKESKLELKDTYIEINATPVFDFDFDFAEN